MPLGVEHQNINTLSGCLPPIEVSPDATTRDLKRRIQEVCPETANKQNEANLQRKLYEHNFKPMRMNQRRNQTRQKECDSSGRIFHSLNGIGKCVRQIHLYRVSGRH
jgi:hypothetical protein